MKKILFGLFLLATACSGPPVAQPEQNTGSTTTQVVSLQMKIDTQHNECMERVKEKPGSCYLPFYTAATYASPSAPINSAPDTKCTPADESKCWGQPTTPVTAICTKQGDYVQNIKGIGGHTWYGVLIPEVEILIDRTSLATTMEGKYVGFAPATWLSATQMGKLPDCGGLVANG